MRKQNHSFLYFFAWLAIGAFLGVIILLFRGDISLDINSTSPRNPAALNGGDSTHYQQKGFAEAVMKAAPAVVSIQTIKWIDPDPESTDQAQDKIIQLFLGKSSPHRPKKQADTGSGSGVIIKSNGYILTNYHVIEKHDEILVRLSDGKVAKAELIGSDPDTDLAILKIDYANLPTLSMASTISPTLS